MLAHSLSHFNLLMEQRRQSRNRKTLTVIELYFQLEMLPLVFDSYLSTMSLS